MFESPDGVIFNCPLCGGVLRRPSITIARQPLAWDQEIRAVRSIRNTYSPFLTGVGFLTSSNELKAHRDETLGYRVLTHLREDHPLFHDSGRFWVFPFHDVCWKLLRDQVNHEETHHDNDIVQHLFSILHRNLYDDRLNRVAAQHYGGTSRFYRGMRIKIHALENGSAFSPTDPQEMVDIDFLITSSKPCSFGPTNPSWETTPQNFTDDLSHLPEEIVFVILSNLSSADVCCLRLASRYVAAISAPERLPQDFWASRFKREFEMGFVFCFGQPFPKGPHPDWRQLHFAVQNLPQGTGKYKYLSLRNRKAILKSLQDICPALSELLTKQPISGFPVVDADLAWLPAENKSVSKPTLGRQICCGMLAGEYHKFDSRGLIWPQTPTQGDICVRVSFVHFDSWCYVSGFRLVYQSNYDDELHSNCVGLAVPHSEREVSIWSEEYLCGMEAALTPSGIIGLRFLVRGPRGVRSLDVGRFDLHRPDTGVVRLLLQNGSRLSGLIISLDLFKIVRLQVVECRESNAAIIQHHHPENNSSDQLLPFDGQIWNPKFPSSITSLSLTHFLPAEHAFQVYLNMDFGGPKGNRLRSLCRIVAFMSEFPTAFLGIEFIYDDGSSLVYGKQSTWDMIRGPTECMQVSACIDGQHGEMISKIEVKYSGVGDEMLALYMHTNNGNSLAFELHDRKYASANAIFKPPTGEIITGIFAVSKSTTIDYATLPAVAMNIPRKSKALSVSSQKPDTGCSSIYMNGFIFTTADLSGVQRLRMARGQTGRSRKSHHISGLWLEYFDGRPAIVGQWIQEFDSFELSPSEVFTALMIWVTWEVPHHYGSGSPQKSGKVIGMRFETSFGRIKHVSSSDEYEVTCMKFRASIFADLCGITWAFNSRWDHVRVLFRGTAQKNKLSILSSAELLPHSWNIIERLFWEDCDTSGHRTTVATIHLFHKEYVTGVCFTYHSGMTRTIGSEDGAKSLLMNLKADEQLTRLDMGNQMHFITLFTDHGNVATFDRINGSHSGFLLDTATVQSTEPKMIYLFHPPPLALPAHDSTKIHGPPEGATAFAGFSMFTGNHRPLHVRFQPFFVRPRRESDHVAVAQNENAGLYSSIAVPVSFPVTSGRRA